MKTWIMVGVIVLLSATLGFAMGVAQGVKNERQTVANECRQSGAFTVNRTGFSCEVVKK